MRYSVAVSGETQRELADHLLREDGQEDVVIATYVLSTGVERTTAIIRTVLLPEDGERLVHGTASFTSSYVRRASARARELGHGLVLLHSHPGARGWQQLSGPDYDTESDYERTVRAITKMPLLGMTLGGADTSWSARLWFERAAPTWAESVRTVAPAMSVTWNDSLRSVPAITAAQERTVSSWGAAAQNSLARLRILVVGVGSVGLDVAQRLAATGVGTIGIMDFDAVETRNLDRMIGATRLDAALGRSKVDVAERLMKSASTARTFRVRKHEISITDPESVKIALDYDVIFSCVDTPWARAVLNGVAYADLIPVLDGGIALDVFTDGRMRNGIWRSHTLVPGRPCMVCIGQLDLGEVALDKEGLLDDPAYINGANLPPRSHQNVAALSASVSAALLAQFVSLVTQPGRRGAPGPLRYILSTHTLQHVQAATGAYCPYETQVGVGDGRTVIALHGEVWREVVRRREETQPPFRLRLAILTGRLIDRMIDRLL
jgi:hypothetical protein